MDIDAKDIQSDLHALKRLYGLLRKDGDGTSNADADLLDEHARLVLKSLLDAATKGVLKVHSEVIAGKVEASAALSPPTQLQQPDKSFEEISTPRSRLCITAQGSQSCEQGIDNDKDPRMDGLDVALWKKKRLTPRRSQAGAVEQSIRSSPANGPQQRQKRCRVCQRNNVKQFASIGEMQFYDVVRNSNRFTDRQINESDRYLWNSKQETVSLLKNKQPDESKSEKGRHRGPFLSNLDGVENTNVSSDIANMCNSDIEATSKPEEVDCLSKEASEAIKQIELCISAVHRGAGHLHLCERSCPQPQNCVLETESAAREMRTQYGTVPGLGMMSLGEENFMTSSNLLHELSGQTLVEPVGRLLYWLPSVTAQGRNQPSYLSLSQTSKLVQPTKAMLRQSRGNFVSRRHTLQSDASGESGESIDECKFPTKKVNKIYGQNVKAIIEKIESGKWMDELVPSGTYNSIARDPNKTSYETPSWPATFPSVSKVENPYQSHVTMEDERSGYRLFQTHNRSGSSMNLINSENIQPVDSCLNDTSTLVASGKNHPTKIMGETLLNKKHSQLLVSSGIHENQSGRQRKDRIPKNRHYTTAARTSLQNQESDGTATELYSSRRSQQTSSRDRDSEDYSLTESTRELQYVTSSRSSGSWGSPLSQGTGSQYGSYTSNSEEEVYTSTSGEGACNVTSSSSSKSEGYSSYEQPIRSYARSPYTSKQPTTKKSGPSRIRNAYGINHKKQSGIWKRLKDTMAIVFHHHHHHHHQHHHHNHGNRTNDQTKTSRNSSLDKREGKVINFKRQEEASEEKAVGKIKKSLVHETRQHGHFHGLMEGLFRHVRQSKPGKGTVDQLAKGQHGRKKTLKKSHWWQLLQHHRGAKLPNKTHMKLELGKKKPA